ncbi:HPr family phosphocarrier protein [Brevundimonas aveniformis]|uniref:HPr family phosphocarrier protein n=1 Tax=Brevundimonas aveniformis TaxID=370977 RepID=UPI002490F097|nr:HPr family phosphocarrier protein [Brevundimonas aveniformis]
MSPQTRAVTICNARGLHARASAKLVKAVAEFDAEVHVFKDGQSVDARSIMGLLMLGAGLGSQVEISADGPDAQAALEAVIGLIEARFDEEG